MRRIALWGAIALLSLMPVEAKKKYKETSGTAVNVSFMFGAPEREAILGYYRVKPLPPGLAKQLRRNGRLPPGLEKKLVVFPLELERRLPPLPPGCGCSRGSIGGHAVMINSRTHVVLDLFALL